MLSRPGRGEEVSQVESSHTSYLIAFGIIGLTFFRCTLSAQEVSGNRTGVSDSVQNVNVREYLPEWYSMITNIPGDWMRYGRMVFRPNNVPAIVGMAALTGVLIVVDDRTWVYSDRWYKSSPHVRSVSDFFEYLGDGRPQFGLAAGFALYGFAAGDRRSLRTASQTVEAILACGIVVQVLKHITGRESPFVSTSPRGIWVPFPNQIDYHKHVPKYDAYPSGHIATALATVTVVAENYPEWGWVRPVGYTIVGLIGISMANTGIHWYSDYPLGLALGYSFGVLAAHPDLFAPGPDAESGVHQLAVSPLLTSRGAGIVISIGL